MPRKKAVAAVTGGPSDYYLVYIDRPSRASLEPYSAELQDIIVSLDMGWNEANAFKAIWRVARFAQGLGKSGNSVDYDIEKALYFTHQMAIRWGLTDAQIYKALGMDLKPPVR